MTGTFVDLVKESAVCLRVAVLPDGDMIVFDRTCDESRPRFFRPAQMAGCLVHLYTITRTKHIS